MNRVYLNNLTNKLRSSAEFFKAKIERRDSNVILHLPPPAEDKERIPTWSELLDDGDD